MMWTERERKLWDMVEPYLDGCKLRPDAPPEVVAADKELYEWAWELNRGQKEASHRQVETQ